MSKRDEHRDFLDYLIGDGKTEYGATFTRKEVYRLLNLDVPEVGTMRQFNAIALKELAAIDYVRNFLLGKGKYLAQDGEAYRVLLPSENQGVIENYMSSADRKLNRALKLSKNTPKQAGEKHDQTQARILMKREGLRDRRRQA